ncbi:30S ribosome-binding factor RbfA [Sodalis sp. CWE]|uniref:30S ribosome-binding factor RbfA n=1 Tax=Sodalis sp. CWE TaxID=2803816 RepID=UPI001C7D8FD3|nr:30S ribosome-binding factor RbfA [Sodalis sp. CWE]MBX4180786.1 30S ribosome-binding factor RbfA [Sodalis sp. CWE]
MIKKYNRIQQISQEIRKKIAVILQQKIKDPRINMVTVLDVTLSRDLTYAKIFVTFLRKSRDPDANEIAIKALQGMAGFIRSLLSKNMYLRIVPKLAFIYDHSLNESIRISKLVDQVVKKEHLF